MSISSPHIAAGTKGLREANPQAGFTLIELMVSVSLFIIVITASIGTLLALINANQKAQSLKSVINNLHFGIDSMARTIRTGHTYHCTDSLGGALPDTAQDCPNGASILVLTDDHGERLAYRFRPGGLDRWRAAEGWVALSAQEVVITDGRFHVTGTRSDDNSQPTVTASIKGHAGTKDATDSSFAVQTTMTQRLLDITL